MDAAVDVLKKKRSDQDGKEAEQNRSEGIARVAVNGNVAAEVD